MSAASSQGQFVAASAMSCLTRYVVTSAATRARRRAASVRDSEFLRHSLVGRRPRVRTRLSGLGFAPLARASSFALASPSSRGRTAQQGVALLEALVAILIFSFGVLGLIGILAGSIRATNDARYRAEAANLANAVIGEMWATAATDLDAQFGAGGPKLTAWQAQVSGLLPSASGANVPVVDLTQPGLSLQSRSVVVSVFWQLPGESVRHQVLITAQIGKNT
jgi:type IV pilus assembly protein PilV